MFYPTTRQRLNQLTSELVTWLDPASNRLQSEQPLAWDAPTWQLAQAVIRMQGIAPYLYRLLPPTPFYTVLPDDFRAWLQTSFAMNVARIDKLHAELQAILHIANQHGIRVMPMKGGLLTTCYLAAPAVRPMADIDLLIERPYLTAMTGGLTQLGYRLHKLPDAYANHFRFVNPHAKAVITAEFEHPDNPRPVEIHTEVRRGLWQNDGMYDVTQQLWASAKPIKILGEAAWVPAPADLLTSLLTHAFRHFFQGEGRMIQWLDLAWVIQQVQILPIDQANWYYPLLCMAQRALPSHFTHVDLTALAAATHPRIRRWSEQVALNRDCGLNLNQIAPEYRNQGWRGRAQVLWEHWRADPWRLTLAYGDTPLPLAYLRYAQVVAQTLWQRAKLGRVHGK